MLLILNILLLVLGSVGALAAFGGETWRNSSEPLLKRITPRGWISLLCLLCALSFGITKEIVSNRISEISAKKSLKAQADLQSRLDDASQAASLAATESQKAQSALQEKLDVANAELAQARIRLKELEDRLLTAIDEATSRIPQAIDHPFFETSDRYDRVVYSYETRQPLKLFAGEIIKYNIHGMGARHLDLITFQIGHREYRLETQAGSITVIGFPRQPMPVLINYPRGLGFAMKMTVESTIRRSMR